MILIQSQLYSIDQSDLLMPRNGKKKKSIQHLLPLFFSFCLTILCMHKFHWLQLQSAHMCIQYIPSKMLLVKSTDPSPESNLFMPNTSNSFVHKHVVFLFVFVCFCLPPVPPSPVASPRQLQDTPAMLNPRGRDR